MEENGGNGAPEERDAGDNEEVSSPEERIFTLKTLTPDFSPEDIIIRSEDFPDVRCGDVLEIYHKEETFPRLLLQVNKDNISPENNPKNIQRKVVYVQKNIAESFHLGNFTPIIANKVEKCKVALEAVELVFKDQYLGRSDMWRLKKQLLDTVLYINKKVGFCKDLVRCTVTEMWARGEKVACGYVTQDTKVVFRSVTAMIYLFIQMSSEMSDFDMHGDLYFEKAVNRYLTEMFSKWNKTGSAHEVSIVLFSRTFYEAKDLSEFPPHMLDCLQQDHRGRFYEDFYRVVVQNERFDDWVPTLTLLRRTFTAYKDLVLNYHNRPGVTIPKASNSTAAQGNFLETLNISVNTFENHFINRNLERTGQQAIVITPGVGIFEVDRDLAAITSQRIIDNGVGSDLVCVGEQPLHVVPLFKVYSKNEDFSGQEEYDHPSWINLSFYTTDKKIGYSEFLPRIKLPPMVDKTQTMTDIEAPFGYFPPSIVSTGASTSAFDCDDYDAQVFALPKKDPPPGSGTLNRSSTKHRSRKQGTVSTSKATGSDYYRMDSQYKNELRTDSESSELGRSHSAVSGMLIQSSGSKPMPGGLQPHYPHHGSSGVSSNINIPPGSSNYSHPAGAGAAAGFSRSAGEERGAVNKAPTGTRPKVRNNNNFSSELHAEGHHQPGHGSGHESQQRSSHPEMTSPSLKPMVFGSQGATSGVDMSQLQYYQQSMGFSLITQQRFAAMNLGRSLVNPFDAKNSGGKLPSNRRRWTHIFPKGNTTSSSSSGPGTSFTPVGPKKSRSVEHHRHQRGHHIYSGAIGLGGGPGSTGRRSPVESVSSVVTSQAGAGFNLNWRVDQDTSSVFHRISDVSAAYGGNVSGGLPHSESTNTLKKASANSNGDRNRGNSVSEGFKLNSYMWASAGEQGFDAIQAAGVDWKSITFPACLPLTTVGWPDERTLNTDYMVSQYNLTPEDYCTDYSQKSPLQNPPLSTREVFHELISQRLSHNFQLVQPDTENGSKELTSSDSSSALYGSQNARRTSLVRHLSQTNPSSEETVWLNIGDIYHKLTLNGQMITVVRYHPRVPCSTIEYLYRYRFLAPDNDTYEMSWILFNMEKLENYNWNYMDFYVCTRGNDQEYILAEYLKYWRYRIYLLPLKPFIPFTKEIADGPPNMRCDIYENLKFEEKITLVEGFLRFIETCMNKIKRPSSGQSVVDYGASGGAVAAGGTAASFGASGGHVKPSRCNTMAIGDYKRPSILAKRRGSNKGLDRSRDRVASGPVKPKERSRTESRDDLKLVQQQQDLVGDSKDNVFNSNSDLQDNEFKLLRKSCTNEEILEAMKNPATGIQFLPKQETFPQHSFVSADAVVWLLEHVEGITTENKAVETLNQMLNKGLICHGSGNPGHPVRHGFFIYHVVPEEKDKDFITYCGDFEAFQSDWMEVELESLKPDEPEDPEAASTVQDQKEGASTDEVDSSLNDSGGSGSGSRLSDTISTVSTIPEFLQPDPISWDNRRGSQKFRSCSVDIDHQKKSERPEWGELMYQPTFRPDQAYEFVLKWSVATGAVIAELVRIWARGAQTNQLCMIPIPGDPFALPSQKSDPIRGPIFVPLDIDCLSEDDEKPLFHEFSPESRDYRMFLFREAIVRRFGFIPCTTDPKLQQSSATFSSKHQYIHCTGNMFIMIPTTLQLQPGIQGIKFKEKKMSAEEAQQGNIISRHPTGNTMPVKYEHEQSETGFLWSWNFMISKKWKNMSVTGATGDIPFMDKMLADFRRFCNNEEGRLREFWDDCRDKSKFA